MITERQRLWQVAANAIMGNYQSNVPIRELPDPWTPINVWSWGVNDIDDKRENPFINKSRKDATKVYTRPPQYY